MTKYLSFKQVPASPPRHARDPDLFIELSGTPSSPPPPSRPASTSSRCIFPYTNSPYFLQLEPKRSILDYEFIDRSCSSSLSIFCPTNSDCCSTFSAHGQNLASLAYITYIDALTSPRPRDSPCSLLVFDPSELRAGMKKRRKSGRIIRAIIFDRRTIDYFLGESFSFEI